ncbi:MAG: DUF2705 family protein [Lachnospiraceae bacterium]|nr:DUF2705 family protein [Lachnospiraceae bacterium]
MNSFAAMLKYDLKNGIVRQKMVYMVAFLLNGVALIKFDNIDKQLEYGPYDCLAYLFEGMYPYVPNVGSPFIVPIVWFSVMMIPAFLIGNYANNDLSGYGSHIILKSKNKSVWFASKVVWCLLSVIIYFLFLVVLTYGFSYLYGGKTEVGIDKWKLCNGFFRNIAEKDVIVFTVIMPLITMITCSILQLAISLIVSTQAAYISIAAFYVMSAYFTNTLFVGNYSMMYKNEYISMGSGINLHNQCIVCGIIILISIAVSFVVVKKRDIYR